MISRRLLRIKIMQVLYAHFNAENPSESKSEKELLFSVDKTYDLYHYLLLLVLEVFRYAESRIDLARNKHIPSADDLNPNTRFIDNIFYHQLDENSALNAYVERKKLSWVNHNEVVKGLYIRVLSADYFQVFMESTDNSYEAHRQLLIDIFTNELEHLEDLHLALEEQSIYWNDDLEFVISMIIKTLKKMTPRDGAEARLMPLYKNEEDRQFGIRLFHRAIKDHENFVKLIEEQTRNWDVERIAFMDILLMQLAIAEIMEFPSIPVKVTFNEYIEISKYYSTAKSSTFINGILDKVIAVLRENNKIVKSGRGLIGDN